MTKKISVSMPDDTYDELEAARKAMAKNDPLGNEPDRSKIITQAVEAWLVEHQLDSGAWGQGEESAAMGGGGSLKDAPSVGDTCVALMALMRAACQRNDLSRHFSQATNRNFSPTRATTARQAESRLREGS